MPASLGRSRDDGIGGVVRALDLRSVKESAAAAKSQVRAERARATTILASQASHAFSHDPPAAAFSLHAAATAAAAAAADAAAEAAGAPPRAAPRPADARRSLGSRRAGAPSPARAAPPPPPSAFGGHLGAPGAAFAGSLRSQPPAPAPAAPSATPGERLAAATASAAVLEVANLHARSTALEACLRDAVAALTRVAAAAGAAGADAEYYSVEFGPGAIGMILTEGAAVPPPPPPPPPPPSLASQSARAAGSAYSVANPLASAELDAPGGFAGYAIEVAELRNDAAGRPLLARASGRIRVGDTVVAIAGNAVARHGPPSLESVAAEFKLAARPVTVLFRRGRGVGQGQGAADEGAAQ